MKRINIEADTITFENRAALVASERGWAPLVSLGVGNRYAQNDNRIAIADAWAEVAEAHLFATEDSRWTALMLRRLRMVWPENRPGPIVSVFVAYDPRCMDWRVLKRPEAARLLGWPSPWASGDPTVEEAATLAAAVKMAAPGDDAVSIVARFTAQRLGEWTADGSLLAKLRPGDTIDVPEGAPVPGCFSAFVGPRDQMYVGSITVGPAVNGVATVSNVYRRKIEPSRKVVFVNVPKKTEETER